MPIAALSERASRAITSSLVLNDAKSAVKELIDNALDSHATNITIEISANTLDVIQVKDNGSGIGVEDRQMICKRGYTSKIRTLDDLAQLGGTFLGFRGEALASIAELSDSVLITTRVDGEVVATQLKFDSSGKLTSSSSASHGTGTTVRISEFLKSTPVRKEAAQKQAVKTLGSIKRLLFDYAFARPTVRFQVKVLKSKSDLKDNWSYAPCKDAESLELTASKIVGKDVAAQCQQESVASEDGGYSIAVLLAKSGADLQKIGRSDQFISIDGRPLTAERGFMRQVNKIYKEFLQNLVQAEAPLPRKIYLYLRLSCPNGTYDVNIEPAKDEVMFEDPQIVLQLFETICKRVYGESSTSKKQEHMNKKEVNHNLDHRNFDLLLAKKSIVPAARDVEESILSLNGKTASTSDSKVPDTSTRDIGSMSDGFSGSAVTSKVGRNMYSLDDEVDNDSLADDHEADKDEDEEQDNDQDHFDAQVHNPFVLAKMNSRIKPQPAWTNNVVSEIAEAILTEVTPEHSIASSRKPTQSKSLALLPSPGTSPKRDGPYQNPGPPLRPWRRRQDSESEDSDETNISLAQVGHVAKPTLLDAWTSSLNSLSPAQESPQLVEVRRSEPLSMPSHKKKAVQHSSPSITSEQRGNSEKSMHQKPFRTPFKKSPDVQARLATSRPEVLKPYLTPGPSSDRATHSPASIREEEQALLTHLQPTRLRVSTELDEIMDFEHRKRQSIIQHRASEEQAQKRNFAHAAVTSSNIVKAPPVALRRIPNEDVPEGSQDIETPYATRFATIHEPPADHDIPVQPKSASHTQNPHMNRYRKAIRDLEARAEGSPKTRVGQDIDILADIASQTKAPASIIGTQTKLSPTDPRAYLIRQHEAGTTEKKLKRSKTLKLPFEVITPDLATYDMLAEVQDSALMCTSSTESLIRASTLLKRIDPYVFAGTIEQGLAGTTVDKEILDLWQGVINDMLAAKNLVTVPRGSPTEGGPDSMSLGL